MDKHRVPNIKPANKSTDDTYEPQGSGMDHSSVFRELVPGSAESGNMAHKWGPPGDHTACEAPAEGLKGD